MNFVLVGASLQGLVLLFLPFAYLFEVGAFWYVLFFICMYWISGMIVGPAWTSWIGDVVPGDIRGTYFGKRNAVSGIVAVVSMIISAVILSYYAVSPSYAFTILFLLAFAMRAVSVYFLSRQYEPASSTSAHSPISFREFLKEADMKNYGMFMALSCFMNFCVFLSAPFFAPYMHSSLSMSFTLITFLLAVATLSKCLFMPLWGKMSDQYGSRKVFSLCAYLMPMVPLLWLVSPSMGWLIFAQIFSGLIWSGYEISSSNFIFEMVPKSKRITCTSYINMINSASILLGGVIGGLIILWFPQNMWNAYLFVFLLSGVLRYGVVFTFVRHLKEVRTVTSISYHRLLFTTFASALPTAGITQFVIPRLPKPLVRLFFLSSEEETKKKEN